MSNSEAVSSARTLTRDCAIWPQIPTSGEKKEKTPPHTHTKIIFQSRPTTAQQPWLLGDFTPSTSRAGGEQSTAGARSQHLTTAQHQWSTQGAPACYHKLHTASL